MIKKSIIVGVIGIVLMVIFLPLYGPEVVVFGPEKFVRGTGKSVTESRTFNSPITGDDLILRLFNGNGDKGHRVTSGTIVLNGEQIVSPDDFKKQVEVTERVVSIHENNQMSVRLEGKPGTFVTIAIYGFAPQPVVNFSVEPKTIMQGEPAVLSWNSQHASSVIIDPDIGSVDLNGSMQVWPVETITYTITASGLGGTVGASVTVTVIKDDDQTFIYGRVFHAENNEPLPGAVISASGKSTSSDADGYWHLMFGDGGLYKIGITKEGFTEVNRKIYLATGQEGLVENAYLTPLDAKVTPIGPAGGTVTNTDETVEVIIPVGALDEVKDIRVTRLPSAKALPGDLNETDNLEYPISFIFCADFRPDDITFNQPVKIRVKNTWGFAPGTEIPYASWDKDTQKWLPINSMAKVDAAGQWLEAELKHFSSVDINAPQWLTFMDGHGDTDYDSPPEDHECDLGSSVDVSTGSLSNEFSIPGIKLRQADTSLSFVYHSKTASPMQVIRFRNFQDKQLVNKPIRSELKINSPMLATGSNESRPTVKTLYFNPQDNLFASGTLILSGILPSGRVIDTGYQNVEFSFSNRYQGEIALVPNWGGMPTGSTGVQSPALALLEDKETEQVFMVSRHDSPFGKGWWLQGLKRIYFEGKRAVVLNPDATFQEYEQGINFADARYGAKFLSSNVAVNHPQSFLFPEALQAANHLDRTQFSDWGVPPSIDTTFVIDLGQVREVFEIGLAFPQYWKSRSVWDYIRITTSIDRQEWYEWSIFGIPTLKRPEIDDVDPLDFRIKSPYRVERSSRQVRYLQFQIGYPYPLSETAPGSVLNEAYALGNPAEYRNLEGSMWPRLYHDETGNHYILEEYSGSQSVFDDQGLMIAQKDPQGRMISYEYFDDKLSKILYPEGVYMEFIYDDSGKLCSVRDSTGRETVISIDSSGGVREVKYPDSSKREFAYDQRGLMITDKQGNASKTYTWAEDYPVLTGITLPNGGNRTIEPAVLKYLLNELDSDEDNPVNYPSDSNTDGLESMVTYEDGREKRHVIGRGWKQRYENGKLKQKTYFASKGKNQLPIRIQEGDHEEETAEIHYNEDLQVTKIMGGKFSDTLWQPVDTDTNAYYVKGSEAHTIDRKDFTIDYNDNRLVSRIRTRGLDNSFTYDADKNLIQVLDTIRNKATRYHYNTFNDLIKIEYPDGKINEFVYDANGLISEVKNNDGTKITVSRNSRGEIVSITDEENRTIHIERDVMGRVIKEISPGGRSVNYVWGGSGCTVCAGSDLKLTKIIDSGNKQWEFKYDIMGNAIEMIYPDGTKLEQEFDMANRLIRFRNKRGQDIFYEYDDDGRLTNKTAPEGTTTFAYDDRDRITSINAPGFHYTYDYGTCYVAGAGSDFTLVKETNLTNGLWTEHIFNQDGLPVLYFESLLWAKGYRYNFTSGTGTPIGFTPMQVWYGKKGIGTRHQVEYTYNQRYKPAYKYNTFFSTYEIYNYDTNGLLNRIRYRPYSGGTFPYTDLNLYRDNSGLITSITGDKQLSASYNNDLEITVVQHTIPQPLSEAYTYDPRGNRLSSLTNSYSYNDLNQLTESTTHTYTYDVDGNLIEEKHKLTTETKKYYYNSENRLIRFEHFPTDIHPADTIAEYTYDLYGRRIQKSVNGTAINFLWDDDNISLELDQNYQPIRRYIYGVGMDNVEGHFEHSESGPNPFAYDHKGWYTYIKDQVGTIYKTFSQQTQQIVNTKTFDVFGNLINQIGTSNSNLGFQGKYYDQESVLYYYYYRYYNSKNGRFINEDPIGLSGDLNMYKFVNDNPMKWLDPFGLNPITKSSEILELACLLFKKADFGRSQQEWGAWFYTDGSVDKEEDWWEPSGSGAVKPKPPKGPVGGSFHTHPTFFPGNQRKRPWRPESPEDRYFSEHYWHKGGSMYVISRRGIWSLKEKIMSYKEFKKWCICHGYWGSDES